MTKRRESWLILFQIYQRESLFHQCQRRLDMVTRVDTTRTTAETPTSNTTMIPPTQATARHHLSVPSNSAHWTHNHHHSFRSPALQRWQPSVASIQTSTWAQLQSPCQLKFKDWTSMDNSPQYLFHKCNITTRTKCRTMEMHQPHQTIRIKAITKTTTTRKTSSREAQRRALSTDMRRRKVRTPKSKKVTKTKAKRSMSPSKRRLTRLKNLSKLQKLMHQPRPRLLLKLSRTLLLNEKDARSWGSEN